jgi:hypothetical protein
VRQIVKQNHFEVKKQLNLETRCSKVDESFVDYYLDSESRNFRIYFDPSLFQAPEITRNLEAELEGKQDH